MIYTSAPVRFNKALDGTSQYFHVRYSDDGKTFTSNGGKTLGKWMGTCVDNSESAPADFNAYDWRKIVGEDGKNGIDGVDGTDGKSSYFFVKFSANANGNPMTEAPDSNTKYMGVCSTTSPTAPTSYTAYKWTQCRGNDGEDGEPGTDGKTSYLHIKYSDDGGLTFTSNNGETVGKYLGLCADYTAADPLDVGRYKWSLIKGEDGAPGKPGEDGTSVKILGSYDSLAQLKAAHPTGNIGDGYLVNGDLHIWDGVEWENVGTIQGPAGADGVGIESTHCTYQASNSGTTVPTGAWLSSVPPVGAGQFLWTRTIIHYTDGSSSTSYSVGYTGSDGTPGEPGADGRTSYLHIKYSDDGQTFTANNGEDLGAWIGTLVDFVKEDSMNFNDYTWKKFTEDVDEELGNLDQNLESIRESVGKLVVDDEWIRGSVRSLEELVDIANGKILETNERVGTLELTDRDFNLKFEKITNDGVAKVSNTTGTFNEDGLEIDNTDSPTKTQVTPDGMTVYKKNANNEQSEVLTAKSDGVDATNLHAKTYLIIGGRSRFENYGSNRTGCFWIGGE